MENLNNIYEWHVKDADMKNILNKIDSLEKENIFLRQRDQKLHFMIDNLYEIICDIEDPEEILTLHDVYIRLINIL